VAVVDLGDQGEHYREVPVGYLQEVQGAHRLAAEDCLDGQDYSADLDSWVLQAFNPPSRGFLLRKGRAAGLYMTAQYGATASSFKGASDFEGRLTAGSAHAPSYSSDRAFG
jgi:hypothetical protein